MAYRVELTAAALQDLRAIPSERLARLDARILALANNPRPLRVERLQGKSGLWRLRVGDYHILYEINDADSSRDRGADPTSARCLSRTVRGAPASDAERSDRSERSRDEHLSDEFAGDAP